MPSMSQSPEGLSDLQERVLLALWKLGSTGRNTVEETRLRTELSSETPEAIGAAIDQLHKQGFLSNSTLVEGGRRISLTPLGLAILRKLEEDRLQELK